MTRSIAVTIILHMAFSASAMMGLDDPPTLAPDVKNPNKDSKTSGEKGSDKTGLVEKDPAVAKPPDQKGGDKPDGELVEPPAAAGSTDLASQTPGDVTQKGDGQDPPKRTGEISEGSSPSTSEQADGGAVDRSKQDLVPSPAPLPELQPEVESTLNPRGGTDLDTVNSGRVAEGPEPAVSGPASGNAKESQLGESEPTIENESASVTVWVAGVPPKDGPKQSGAGANKTDPTLAASNVST